MIALSQPSQSPQLIQPLLAYTVAGSAGICHGRSFEAAQSIHCPRGSFIVRTSPLAV